MDIAPERIRAIQGRALCALARVLGSASPDATTYGVRDIAASIVPAAPDDADANLVAFTNAERLVPSLPDITRMYKDAGVTRWSIYVPESDEHTARSLASFGYRKRDRLPAIMLDLPAFDPRPLGDLDYDISGDFATLGSINAAAYDRPELGRAFVTTPAVPDLRVYQARLDGRPVCVLLTLDVPHADGIDCAAYFLATLPDARRRAVAPRLFTAALVEARARGCTTASGQASPMGAPIYAKMGFRTAFYYDRHGRDGA
ncbi:GNAT family N-acetyltransferase [Streptomyces sp. NPDC052494]|uniref:GNAT family N-acetyltransferase n=1 Tax=Streptomyces sp. NPDC052494 TaxID=3365692 RepID=UPI0037D664F3